MPALLTSTCSGPRQPATNAATESRSDRSSRATRTCVLPVLAVMSAAARWPALTSRTARVTSALAAASARAVSTPMPDEPPVTMMRRPVRSIPAMTSAAVACAPNPVVMRWVLMGCDLPIRLGTGRGDADTGGDAGQFGVVGDALEVVARCVGPFEAGDLVGG